MPSLIIRSYSCRSGSWLSSTLAPGGISVGAAGRGLATVPAARSGSAAGRALAVVPGCDRAWAWVIDCALGGDAEELVQVLAGDQVSTADFDVGQVCRGASRRRAGRGTGRSGGRPRRRSRPAARSASPGRPHRWRWCRRGALDPGCARAGWLVRACARAAGAAGRSLSRLGVGSLTFPVMLLARAAGLGGPVDRVGSGQAEFGGPGLDEWPELVLLVQVRFAGVVGEGHGGDGAVAVQGPAGQPGHLPQVLTAGGQPGGVRGLVAGHGGVVDDQGHGSASRSGSGSRVRPGPASRSSAREGGWPGRQSRSWSTTITYSGRCGQWSGNGRS